MWQRGLACTLALTLAACGNSKIGSSSLPPAGTPSAPPIMEAMAIIGPDMTRARLREAIAVLGGVSKKETKVLEAQLAAFRRGESLIEAPAEG